jgi:hypothetical protein
MCASIVVLLFTVGADGPARGTAQMPEGIHPPDAQPTAICGTCTGSAACAIEGCVVYGRPGPWPSQPNPVSAYAWRAADSVAEKFGFSYYYGLIPYHGPAHYSYRYRFDYPWHATPGSRCENRLTIVGDSAK